MHTTIHIKGTHCASCKAVLEDVLADIAEIASSTVNYETGETAIEHSEEIDWNAVKKEIESLAQYSVDINHRSS